ncbi:MAG: anaerobic benzoate catabolism transcriptional regulator [Pelotomaculum sp. PtaB.Bin013]|uniref:Helix-turn-helix domain-containing protein n=1 Tax=Pelotomaculum isophthalicicum JI TaxID=947010 RepID=A0A9X4GYX5_9FIRM|nr:helix-turn-helix transcriptional regulator [Pelotomaculum isophthalicicum]MDF9408210.1 helix-turn-helix domain-containing protein [Pelotomaculum isophthalicicum JI]OPX91809.1 MAG: anaerobic benzoate catabolism transcriptional regulator [Pelotomaculum sp. PtaB.Bin013]
MKRRVPTFSEIGARIRELREKHGMSQDQLATELGLSRPVVTKIEGGKKAINSLELRQIADILGVSTDLLMDIGEEDEETLVGRFRARQKSDDKMLVESVEQIEHIFKEILGQIKLWRQSNG